MTLGLAYVLGLLTTPILFLILLVVMAWVLGPSIDDYDRGHK